MESPRSDAHYVKILKDLGDTNAWVSLEETTKFLDEVLPDKYERDLFETWVENRRPPKRELVTPGAVIDLIRSTDFATQSDSNILLGRLQFSSPYIPIGVMNGGPFRLAPHPFYLQSEFDYNNDPRPSTDDPDDGPPAGVMHTIMSVDLPPPPTPAGLSQSGKDKYNAISRSLALSSKPSHAKSPDQGSTLYFHQLGELEYDYGSHEGFHDWSTTDFGVVVEITDDYKAGGIYLICNFRGEHDDGYTLRIDKNKYSNWGRLICDSGNRFSCAKIADSIDDLGEDVEFKLDIRSRSPFKLTHLEWESRIKALASTNSKQSESRTMASANINGNDPNHSISPVASKGVTVGR